MLSASLIPYKRIFSDKIGGCLVVSDGGSHDPNELQAIDGVGRKKMALPCQMMPVITQEGVLRLAMGADGFRDALPLPSAS